MTACQHASKHQKSDVFRVSTFNNSITHYNRVYSNDIMFFLCDKIHYQTEMPIPRLK